MTLVRANPPNWALFELLTSAQMNVIDSQLPRALDGQDGGTYNLQNPLILSGTAVPASPAVLEVEDGPNAPALLIDSNTTGGIVITNDGAGRALDIYQNSVAEGLWIQGGAHNTASPLPDVATIVAADNAGGAPSPALFVVGAIGTAAASEVMQIVGHDAPSFNNAVVEIYAQLTASLAPQVGFRVQGGDSSGAGGTGAVAAIFEAGSASNAGTSGSAVQIIGDSVSDTGQDALVVTGGSNPIVGGAGASIFGGDCPFNAGQGLSAYGGDSSNDGTGGYGLLGYGGAGIQTGFGGHGVVARGGSHSGGSTGQPGAGVFIQQTVDTPSILFSHDQAPPTGSDRRPRALNWNQGLKASVSLSGGTGPTYGGIMPFVKASGYVDGTGGLSITHSWRIINATFTGAFVLNLHFDGLAPSVDYMVFATPLNPQLLGGPSNTALWSIWPTTRLTDRVAINFRDSAGTNLDLTSNALGFELMIWDRE